VEDVVKNALWILRRNAEALRQYFDSVMSGPTNIFYDIKACTISAGMKLRENDKEGARKAVEKLGDTLREIESLMNQVSDAFPRQLFEEMKEAFETLRGEIENVPPTEMDSYQSYIQNLIRIVETIGPRALQNLKQAVQNLKDIVLPIAGMSKEIAYLEKKVEILFDALQSGEVERVAHLFNYDALAAVIYKFLYKPLMAKLPEERYQEAQTYFKQIFESLAELEVVVNYIKELRERGIKLTVPID
jgi:archaellum component FlaC